MRVLHLFSNCKWTGPAEPALNLCLSLRARGVQADFACAPDAGKSVNMVVETARSRGVEPILRFHLYKHPDFFHTMADRRNIEHFLRTDRYDLIHCHLLGDHNVALRASRRLGIPLLRSSYEGMGLPNRWRSRSLLSRCDFLIEPSQMALEHDAALFGFPREQMQVVPNAIDTARFDPARSLPDLRARLGIPADRFVFGIVARMQTHRNYEVLFEAMHRVRQRHPAVHLVVVGRGTYQDSVCHRPVADLGLQEHVTFTGYVSGDDYVGALATFNAGVFLVPGSDGTCRAVREIMAMGKPMLVANRGMLAEIAQHERQGLVFDGSVDALSQGMERLLNDATLTTRLAEGARSRARHDYALETQAAAVHAIYQRILGQA